MNTDLLTEDERRDFVRNGYVAKRGILDDDACRRCLALSWRELEKKSIRQDPSSWKANPYLRPRKGVVKLRDEVNRDPELLQLVGANQALNRVATALMGEQTLPADVRGIYTTFPIPRLRARPYDAHVEQHPVQIFVMLYLDDVTSRNAPMCVWPGTHTMVWRDFSSKFDYLPKPSFHPRFDRLNAFEPVELIGKRGDAFFCHHRVMHGGSNNLRERVRFGILVDFLRSDFEAMRAAEPGEEMWDYWSDAVHATAARREGLQPDPLRSSPPRSLMLKSLQTIRRLRGQRPDAYAP